MALALRFALRELRGGLTGLRLLAICLFLGVAGLAGVGSLGASIVEGLSLRGQEILGGDVAIELGVRRATDAERAAFAEFGDVSEGVRMRAMVGEVGGDTRVLGELKAVDGVYPLYGDFRLAGGTPLQTALSGPNAVIAQALADQLDLAVGDRIELGNTTLTVSGVIENEPDRASEGFTLGPSVMISMETLPATGLVQPGSLFQYHYRLRMPPTADIEAVEPALKERFPDAGWDIDDRTNGAPGVRRFVERISQFLTLVGLTALVVAGVGVGNGVASYLDAKSGTIATLKSLGATSRLIFQSYLLQIGLVALVAVAVGALVGAAVPWAVVLVAGSALPAPPELGLYPVPLLTGAAYGVLIAVVFALWPLARACSVPAARLFRAGVEPVRWPGWPTLLAVVGSALAIAAIAIAQAREPLFAAGFIAAALALLLILTGLAAGVRAVAARLPRPKGTLLRLALANLHRPGALTRQLVVALGLGLTLFATLAVIETNLSGQINRSIPDRAPSFFFLDIPSPEVQTFEGLVRRHAPAAELRLVPSLRGPVVAVDGQRVSEMKDIPDGAWILRGDRGLTYANEIPQGNRLVGGEWWPEGYDGPPLVSLDVEAAQALGVGVGDTLTISVLGVEITAEIASLREIDWDSLGFNFVMIFSPNTLQGAPHSFMATAAVSPSEERALYRDATRSFPTVSVIRVKDVIETAAGMLTQLSAAVRSAASVAVAAGIAVLVGALAAGRRARTYDAVLLKVLGATRWQVLRALLIEYGVLAAIVSGLAFGLGTLAGWYVVTQTFDLEWLPSWPPVVATVLIGAAVTIGLGLVGSWSALSARPNRVLRTL
ncbi:ABC transporter permease [Sphingoaurantiacus capsulatus]|uniref:ABC transporter permease n=1 Tax=Sphingoaurantiacus capsulatus TaxID=1771310 RepID=A0ABV7X6L2_9SPHN